MIIDADCHIASRKLDGNSILAEELVVEMDRAGVDKALIWLKPPYNKDIEPENRAVYEATKKFPGRFFPFGWVNPLLGKSYGYDTIKRCFEEYGFVGIKFNGAQDGYIIDDDQLTMPLIEQAATYHKPIAFHIGADFYENTHPYRLGRIASKFPATSFLMVHMGGAGTPSLDKSAVEMALQHPNITLIGSAITENPILRAIKKLGADRICFGSDIPFRMMHVQLAMYRALMRDLDMVSQEKILGGNLARLMGVL